MRTLPAWNLSETERRALAQRLVSVLGAEYPEWSVEDEVRDLANPEGLPYTLCALDRDGTVIGSGTLLPTDEVSGFEAVTPWLGDLLVSEAHRNRGIGAALVHALIDEARTRGHHELHLVTTTRVRWYQQLGWQTVGEVHVHGHPMTCMRIAL